MQLGSGEQIQSMRGGPCVLERGALYSIGNETEGATSWMYSDMISLGIPLDDNSVYIYNRSQNFCLVRIIWKDDSEESTVLVRGDIKVPRKVSKDALNVVSEITIPISDIRSFEIMVLDDTFLKGLAGETDEGAILTRAYRTEVINLMRRCVLRFEIVDGCVKYRGCEDLSETSQVHIVNGPLGTLKAGNDRPIFRNCVIGPSLPTIQIKERHIKGKKVVTDLSIGEALNTNYTYKVGLMGIESACWMPRRAFKMDFIRENGERLVRVKNNSAFLCLVEVVFWDGSKTSRFAITKPVRKPESYDDDPAEIELTWGIKTPLSGIREFTVIVIAYNYLGPGSKQASDGLTDITRSPDLIKSFERCEFYFKRRLRRLYYRGHKIKAEGEM